MTEKTEPDKPHTDLSEEFQSLDLDKLLPLDKDCRELSTMLYSEAEALHDRQQQIVTLLAHCCSMHMTVENHHEPFRPYIVMADSRSYAPGDFSEEELAFLAEIYPRIDHPHVKARIADIGWVRSKDFRAGNAAIKAYLAVPILDNTWNSHGRDYAERAATICLMLGKGAREHLAILQANLQTAFAEARYPENGYFPLQLGEVLLRFQHPEESAQNIAQSLEDTASAAFTDHDYVASRQYAEIAAKWHASNENEAKRWEMTELQARSWVSLAEAQLADQDNALAALTFYDHAIKLYRSVPRAHRSEEIEQELVRLEGEYRNAGQLSADSMVPMSTSIDISDMIRDAVSDIGGKPLTDALYGLANLTCPRKASIRKLTEESISKFPVSSLGSSTSVLSDGRVFGKSPGAMDDYEAHIWHKMLEQYSQEVLISTRGLIIPGLETFSNEHRLSVRDFVHIAHLSLVAPPDRHHIIGKGLYEGYQSDFASAISILVPQLENIIRYHLSKRGVDTTTTTPEGLIHYVGMSALVEKECIDEIFGENFVFEFKAMFCDSQGFNLRNDLAHRILDDERYFSVEAVYAWHIVFRLVFNSYWIAARKQDQKNENKGSP
jgi:hypothetical protein